MDAWRPKRVRCTAAILGLLLSIGNTVAADGAPAGPGRLVVQVVPPIERLTIDPSGRMIASAEGNRITFYSLPARAMLATYELPISLQRLEFVGGGRWIFVADAVRGALVDLDAEKVAKHFQWVSEGAEEGWCDLSFARGRPRGFGLANSERGLHAVPFEIRGTLGTATVATGTPWRVPGRCERVRSDPTGRLAIVQCADELRLYSLDHGFVRAFPRGNPRLSIEEGAWFADSGRWLALRAGGRKGEVAWLDLELGRVERFRPPANRDGTVASIDEIGGVLGPESELLVLSGEHLVTFTPTRGFVGQTTLGVSGATLALDEANGIVALATSAAISLFDRSGAAIGRIGGDVRPPDAVVLDPATDRLFATFHEGTWTSRIREVDLAEGELRSISKAGAPSPVLVEVSDTGGEFSLVDRRSDEREALHVEGLDPDASVLWGVRAGPGHAVIAVKDQLGLVDLAKRRIEAWLPRTAGPRPTLAQLLPRSAHLLLLLPDGTLETWDVVRAMRIGDRRTPWREGSDVTLHGVGELPGGSLVFGASDGLHITSSSNSTGTTEILRGLDVVSVAISPDGHWFVIEGLDRTLLCPVIANDLDIPACSQVAGTSPAFLLGGAQLAVRSRDRSIAVYRTSDLSMLASVFAGPDDAYLFTTPDGAYKASPNGLGLAVLAQGLRVRLLEEVDVRLNRPSVVLNALGRARPERVEMYRALELRRREREGYQPALLDEPEEVHLDMVNQPLAWTTRESITVKVRVRTATPGPVRLVARVNGVPIGGRAGQASGRVPGPPAGPHEKALQLPVGPGENRVVLTAVDAVGRESPGARFVVTGTGVRRKGRVFLLGIGVSRYRDETHSLKYAAKDVRDVAEALRHFEGKRLHAKVLLDDEVTRSRVLRARAFLEQARFEDLVIVYVAGHGLLSGDQSWRFATHDVRFADREPGGIRFEEFEVLLDGLGAGNKVLFIDSCHAGAAGRGDWKSVAAPPGARGLVRMRTDGLQAALDASRMSEVFADLRRGTGATVIAAAAREEYAFEAGAVGNGMFTHAVLKSLREAAGVRSNGELWLDDLVLRVRSQVSELTRGMQRPHVRDGNIAFRRPFLSPDPAARIRTPATPAPVEALATSDDRTRLAILSGGRVSLVSLKDGTDSVSVPYPRELDGSAHCESATPCSPIFAGNGRRFYLASRGNVFALDLKTRLWRRLLNDQTKVSSAIRSPDGSWLLLKLANGGEALLDLRSTPETIKLVSTDVGRCAWAAGASVLHCFQHERAPDADCFVPPTDRPSKCHELRGFIVEWDPKTQVSRIVRTLQNRHTEAADQSISPDGLVIEHFGTVQEVVGGAGGAVCGTFFKSKQEVCLPGAPWGVVLTRERPVLLEPPPEMCAPQFKAEVPILDVSGEVRGTMDSAGSPRCAAQAGRLLLRKDVIVAAPISGGLRVSDLDRRAETLFRIHDAHTGQPAGWFSAPLKHATLVDGAGGNVYVVDTSTGAIFRFRLSGEWR